MGERECALHHEPIVWKCHSCGKDLCGGCLHCYSNKNVLCEECAKNRSDQPSLLDVGGIQGMINACKVFNVVGIIGMITNMIIVFPKLAHEKHTDSRLEFYQHFWFWIVYFLVGSLFFFILLRCPACNCRIYFYFKDSFIELFRFRNCPRCGCSLRG